MCQLKSARYDTGSAQDLGPRNAGVRAMLDREGAADPSDVAIVGSEEEVAAAIARFAEAGATEFSAAAYGSSDERARTWSLLGSLA